VAQVVLENVYKSFPRRYTRRTRSIAAPSAGWVAPVEASQTQSTPVQDSNEAGHEDIEPAAIAVLRRINLTIRDSEFMVLVGPSGCGKSTLLRLLAGLEPVTGGNIWVGDRLVNHLPPKQRDIAMVFQSYALYPHMTVYDNLAFGLRRTPTRLRSAIDPFAKNPESIPAKFPLIADWLTAFSRPLPPKLRYQSSREQAIDQRVQTVAQMLQLESLLDRLPRQLSGGQKQRVALGRAMARNPQVFLMDEPLSNLDAKLRTETRAQIVNLQRKLGTTTIYVTHDQTEAMTMGDRIAVMNAGQIQQIAPPLELYNAPANRFVAEFIGSPPMNFLPVQVKAPLLISHAQFRLTLPDAWENKLRGYDGRSLTLGIRPEHLSISVPAPKNLLVQVDRVEALGSETYIAVHLVCSTPEPLMLQARVEPDRTIAVGEQLWLSVAPDKIHLFDPATDIAL
jgi:multiple sugar transport system ATP-binding protein